jgi:hypothetical protein
MWETGNYFWTVGMDEEGPSSQAELDQQMERDLRDKMLL